MRISDWSSDVCSSDLTKGVEPSGQSETRHRVVAKVREAAVRPDEREVPDAPASRKIGVHVRGGLKSELFDHGRQDRSEEHTSELQSLMRISYAVFCLKKKKTSKH